MRSGFDLSAGEARILSIAHGSPTGEVWLDRQPNTDWHEDLNHHHAMVMFGALDFLAQDSVHLELVGVMKETRRYRITQFGRALLEEHLARSSAES